MPDVLRLELLVRLLGKLQWVPSDSVVCERGRSQDMLRVIKRYRRVAGIVEHGTHLTLEGIPKSPYAATYGARLMLNDTVLEQYVSEPSSLDAAQEPHRPSRTRGAQMTIPNTGASEPRLRKARRQLPSEAPGSA